MQQALQVLWDDVDEAASRAVDVGDEQKRDGDDQRNDEEQHASGVARAVANLQVGADGDGDHQGPRRGGNAVPPRRLGIALRVQHIVHACGGERHRGRGLRLGRSFHRRPQLRLQLGGVGIDLLQLFAVPQ